MFTYVDQSGGHFLSEISQGNGPISVLVSYLSEMYLLIIYIFMWMWVCLLTWITMYRLYTDAPKGHGTFIFLGLELQDIMSAENKFWILWKNSVTVLS